MHVHYMEHLECFLSVFVHVALSCTLQLLQINQIIHLAYACTLYGTLGMFSVCICTCGLIMHLATYPHKSNYSPSICMYIIWNTWNVFCLYLYMWSYNAPSIPRLKTYLEDNEYFLCSIIMFLAFMYLEDSECRLFVLSAPFDSSSLPGGH